MFRLTVTFESGRSCSGTFPTMYLAEGFAAAIVNCCEDVLSLELEVVDDD